MVSRRLVTAAVSLLWLVVCGALAPRPVTAQSGGGDSSGGSDSDSSSYDYDYRYDDDRSSTGERSRGDTAFLLLCFAVLVVCAVVLQACAPATANRRPGDGATDTAAFLWHIAPPSAHDLQVAVAAADAGAADPGAGRGAQWAGEFGGASGRNVGRHSWTTTLRVVRGEGWQHVHMTGGGSDGFGAFTIVGVWRVPAKPAQASTAADTIRFVKRYDRHTIHYSGAWQDGAIRGHWTVTNGFDSGWFWLRPPNAYQQQLHDLIAA